MGLEVRGVDELKAKLDEVAARARDLTPVLTVAAQDTRTLIDDSFAGSTTPENVPWAPLADSTVQRRRRGSNVPLVDTANLRNSITAYGRGTTLKFGSSVPYAAPHQFGFTRSGQLKNRSYRLGVKREAGTPWTTRVPARPFFPVAGGGSAGYSLMTQGQAGAHWTYVRNAVRTYITTGRVT